LQLKYNKSVSLVCSTTLLFSCTIAICVSGCNQKSLESFRELNSSQNPAIVVAIDGGKPIALNNSLSLTTGQKQIVIELENTERFSLAKAKLFLLHGDRLAHADSCVIDTKNISYTKTHTTLKFPLKVPDELGEAFLRIEDTKRGVVAEIPIRIERK
jgi:hypothetical protein